MPKGSSPRENSADALDMDQKIELLRRFAKISDKTLIDELFKKKGMFKRITRGWLTQSRSEIHLDYRKRFVEYWREREIPIPFEDECYPMSIKEFRAYPPIAALLKETAPPVADKTTGTTHKFQKLFGIYQIIRPHSSSNKSYVLETLEIRPRGQSIENIMYSHTQRDKKFLYRGEVFVARRYYFSLLNRPHEYDPDNHAMTAHRCIAFYVGAGASDKRLSGLMLRGMSGSTSSGTPAVSIPFIAIHVTAGRPLEEPDFVALTEDGIDRVHKDGHVLVGDLSSKTCPALFAYCDRVFRQLSKSKALIPRGSLVLRTVLPDKLKEVEGLNFDAWKAAVESCYPLGPKYS